MKPAAWVRNLTDPQPHCVTDLKYMSAADTDAGVQYVPLYTKCEWKSLSEEDIDEVVNQTKGFCWDSHTFAREIETKLKEKNNG